jgi:hypothetical protein
VWFVVKKLNLPPYFTNHTVSTLLILPILRNIPPWYAKPGDTELEKKLLGWPQGVLYSSLRLTISINMVGSQHGSGVCLYCINIRRLL